MTEVETEPRITADQIVTCLEGLAAELSVPEYHALVVSAAVEPPLASDCRGHTNVATPGVVLAAGWFWYSFTENPGSAADILEAAQKIERMLHDVGSD